MVALAATGLGPLAPAASAITVTHYPMAVVMCTFADQGSNMELPMSYYQAYFSPGTGGIYDYFNQVSYGQASVDATLLGPYTVPAAYTAQFYPTGSGPMTLNQYMGLSRFDQIRTCLGTAADAGVDLTGYKELIALQVSHDRLAAYGNPATSAPAVQTALTAPAAAADTTIQVQSSAGFPAPPFPASISSPTNSHPTENVQVTAESGAGNTVWTVTRGFESGSAQQLNAGDQVVTPFSSDIGAIRGPQSFTVGTSHQENLTNVGVMTMDPLGSPVIVAQEISHGVFNMNHSRDLISPQVDYRDYWDVMSGLTVYYEMMEPPFAQQAGYSTTPEQYGWGAGPGFNAVNLDYAGWLSPGQEDTTLLSSSSCTSQGITLDALSQPQGDYLEARLPYVSQSGFPANGMYYTVEYRNPAQTNNNTIWDAGIPNPTVLVHLAVQPSGGSDPYISYLVDSTVNGALDIEGAQPGGQGGTPQFVVGSTFVDPTSHAYLAVNGFTASGQARVTIGNCQLPTQLSYTGATSGDFNDTVTLSGVLSTNPATGSSYPVVNQPVTFQLGSQSCSGTTDSDGRASCQLTLTQSPGSTTVSASFAGTTAYQTTTAPVPFTMNPEDTMLTYTGPTSGDYHDPVVLSAALTDPADASEGETSTPIAGKTIAFSFGGESCSGTTDATGTATCAVTPQDKAGSYPLTVSFNGDNEYRAASDTSQSFNVTLEESTLSSTSKLQLLPTGQADTLSATLLEDGQTPIQGRTLALTLGSGSTAVSCTTGPTDATGTASCTVTPPATMQGPQTITDGFTSDGYYQSASNQQQALVFTYIKGTFALGDVTAKNATPSTMLTWWADQWSHLNGLSGGAAPPAFKGFAPSIYRNGQPVANGQVVCGTTYNTAGGNSSMPPATVPAYMAVAVSDKVTKSGNIITGDIPRVVIVKTNPGYQPDPGHPGAGTVVAQLCP